MGTNTPSTFPYKLKIKDYCESTLSFQNKSKIQKILVRISIIGDKLNFHLKLLFVDL